MIRSVLRMKAIMIKEIRQLSRDRITFGMVIMILLYNYFCSGSR